MHLYYSLIWPLIVQNIAHLHATICSAFIIIDQGPWAAYILRQRAKISAVLLSRIHPVLWIEGALVSIANQ